MFTTVLIANRGAIATRIIRTLKKMNIRAVAVYHQSDAQSLHVQNADDTVCLGNGTAADTYLNIDKIIHAAKQSGAQAIHPGYGFLSENTDFVARCEQEDITFIGPNSHQIKLFGLKHEARDAAEAAGVPLVPGSALLTSLESACDTANTIGYPVMLKSTAGGGGIGMQVCHSQDDLQQAWESVKRLSANFFANDGVFLEKYITHARHIEVQIFGDGKGQAISLGERDCSAQRRNQKVVEETPAPNLTEATRHALWQTAEKLMASVQYRNAGTVEFIYDNDTDTFYFLEVNTRLQVEHGVTEEVWSIDLVSWMLRQAANELGDITHLKKGLTPKGHAIQVRIYAEDTLQDFRPNAGLLSHVAFPKTSASEHHTLRIDSWVESGIDVPALFDPMIAKIICHSPNRPEALAQLHTALSATSLYGIETNLDYVLGILASSDCQQGTLLTNSLASFEYNNRALSILSPGTMTTLQDYPGRRGYWHVGVPPSGPMDALSFQLANLLLGNANDAVALEITLNGPTLHFHSDTHIALSGADIQASLNGKELAMYCVHKVEAGETLVLGQVTDSGARSYLAIAGGIRCPEYLGSRATFTLGQFGGHNGRALMSGDVLHLHTASSPVGHTILAEHRPQISNTWKIHVLYGPHGAPDFFTDNDIQTFFEHEWEVHYNSSRTGVRLIGPKPNWARETGGEAGLHPSNIHDNAYAFGTIDFTGDMPVILGPDGPSLGGFVCPATVIKADLWKLGQLKAGAKIRFIPVSIDDAVNAEKAQCDHLALTQADTCVLPATHTLISPIVETGHFQGEDMVLRCAGDHFLLIELGILELDIERRFKIHALMLWLQEHKLAGMHELTPGIRSLQIHYDAQVLPLKKLIKHIHDAAASLEKNKELTVPSRIVHLPLSWDDEACQLAVEKYQQSVRADAPWCPSNLEFIRRINGLKDIQAVKDIVFDAAYLVMGLGDVYLGAPVATPVNPSHRLVTTKYNPARTWTAENSVGIGGAYMCIYGMEGPGGYQFIGRTLQMWNRYRQTEYFQQPWLLRFFDQIRFYEVSHDDLQTIRDDFPLGRYPIKIEETNFNLNDYRQQLRENDESIKHFSHHRSAAFEQELTQWRQQGALSFEAIETIEADHEQHDEGHVPEGTIVLDSPVSGSIWQINIQAGDYVEAGQTLMILESMKMEITIDAPHSGYIHTVLPKTGHAIRTGQALIWLSEKA